MTAKELEVYWESNYGNCPMIGYLFSTAFPDRWFRIHSLPQSRRYPKHTKDWKILLERHNQIITDILGNDTNVLLITGSYHFDDNHNFINEDHDVFKKYDFNAITDVDLHKLSHHNYDEGQIFRPSFTKVSWNQNKYDTVLSAVADDHIRLFFLSIEKNVIIASYDGGIDLILKDTETRDFYKSKYKEWLSITEIGA
jgi:hypothetical protein